MTKGFVKAQMDYDALEPIPFYDNTEELQRELEHLQDKLELLEEEIEELEVELEVKNCERDDYEYKIKKIKEEIE